jgi:nucleoside-diphosphate-sugar epimerase
VSATGRVFVTGAAGFLGAALTRTLLRDGHEVLAASRSGPGAWRLRSLPATASLHMCELDLRSLLSPSGRLAALQTVGDFKPDVVAHAAWSGVRGEARDDPGQFENVALTMEVVRLAADAGAGRFVGLGSQAEYGPHDQRIQESTATRPATLYGVAKLAAGHAAMSLCERWRLSGAWARVFSVYGPGQREGALIPDLARALRQGTPYPLGSGEAIWDYLFEEDASEALTRLVLNEQTRGFFNLASGHSTPVREVMLLIGKIVAPLVDLQIGTRGPTPGELSRLEADVTRIREATGWGATTGLDEGIARTLEALF